MSLSFSFILIHTKIGLPPLNRIQHISCSNDSGAVYLIEWKLPVQSSVCYVMVSTCQECNWKTPKPESFISLPSPTSYLWEREGCRNQMLSSRSFRRHKTSALIGIHAGLYSAQPSSVANCPKKLWGFHLWRYSKFKWASPEWPELFWPCSEKGRDNPGGRFWTKLFCHLKNRISHGSRITLGISQL